VTSGNFVIPLFREYLYVIDTDLSSFASILYELLCHKDEGVRIL